MDGDRSRDEELIQLVADIGTRLGGIGDSLERLTAVVDQMDDISDSIADIRESILGCKDE